MKRIIVVLMAIGFLATGLAFAKTYKPVTGDNEVLDINDVQVKETDVISVTNSRVTSLKAVDYAIAQLDLQIAALQAAKAAWVALRPLILTEAEKVALKVPEPDPIE